MDNTQYRQFLNNPVTFLNGGPVSRLRINVTTPGVSFRNSIKSTENFNGSVPTSFQYSDSRVTPISLRYENTGIAPTSALWAQTTRPPVGNFVNDRAYYLQWSADQAYAIELKHEAQLFFTAQVDGCGILVFETPQKLIIVHHNIQVAAAGQSFLQSVFESQGNYQTRDRNNRFDARARALQELSAHIIANNPSITGGTSLDARQYMSAGHAASVFGIKRGGRWRIYVNSKTGANYRTKLMYG